MFDEDAPDAAGAGDGRDRRHRKAYEVAYRYERDERRRRDRPEPRGHCSPHESDDDSTRAVTLERHAIETAQHLHHAYDHRRDAGDIRNRYRDDTADGCISRVTLH